jgi:secreted trypsin-like serine protease
MWKYFALTTLLAVISFTNSCRVIEELANGFITRRDATAGVSLLEVFVGFETKFLCTGMVISENYVLTSASCVFGATFVNVHVYAHKLRDVFEDKREIHRATQIHFNNYDGANHINDIAIIELPTPLNFTNKSYMDVPPLPENKNLVAGISGWTFGWGLLNFKDDNAASYLNANTMLSISMEECMSAYPHLDWSEGAQGRACIKRPDGFKNCVSDSGSPFFAEDATFYAIQSSGQMKACDDDDFPNLVTNLPYHTAWIKSKSGL